VKTITDYDPELMTGPDPDIRKAKEEQAQRMREGLGKALDDWAAAVCSSKEALCLIKKRY